MSVNVLKSLNIVMLFFVTFTAITQAQTTSIEPQIMSGQYSPDGSLIAIGGAFSDFYGVQLLTPAGELLSELTTDSRVTSVSWSPDGKSLAVRIPSMDGYDEEIVIYDMTRQVDFSFPLFALKTTVRSENDHLPWSLDGGYIAHYRGVTIAIWDTKTGALLPEIITGDSGWDSIEDVAWHPITNELYVLDSRNGLRVYDPTTGKPTRDTLLLPLSEPQSTESNYLVASELAFNADGSELAIVFNDFYQTTRFIDPLSGKTLREFRPENPDFDIRTLRWSADDAMVMTVGAPSFAIRFWDAQTGRLLQSYDGLLGGYVRDFVVSPDMTQMVVIGGYPQSAGMPSAAPLQDWQGLTLESGHALLLYLNMGRVPSD